MSLLLEALKKAELAKQAAKDPSPTGAPPLTRDKLPDITQPMEIHSDDLSLAKPEPAPPAPQQPALELALEQPAPPLAPAMETTPTLQAAPAETAYSPPAESTERQQAQQLFEAKELDVNPRKPFYYTMAALGVFALGTVGYFWYQLQPRSSFRTPPAAASQPPAPSVSSQPALPPAAPQSASAPAAAPAAPPAAAVPPPAAAKAAEPPVAKPAAPVAAPAPAAARGPVFARQSAAAAENAAAQVPEATRDRSSIVITATKLPPDPVLDSAFDAFNAGDLTRARSGYEQVLQSRPDDRDALLGLAAIETRLTHNDVAENYYRRLLELDPRDARAQAGMIGLGGQVDPVAAESRLKSMIAARPDATYLYFTLGNQYAAQQRWAEAQQAYFKAYSGDPEHPDFAYNLAVSLDQLHQSAPALEYYRRALALAQNRTVAFDKNRVNDRVAQLER